MKQYPETVQLQAPKRASETKKAPARFADTRTVKWCRKAIEGELNAVRTAPKGNRNNGLNSHALRALRVAQVAPDTFNLGDVQAKLEEAGIASGLDPKEARDAVESALKKAIKEGPAEDAPGARNPIVAPLKAAADAINRDAKNRKASERLRNSANSSFDKMQVAPGYLEKRGLAGFPWRDGLIRETDQKPPVMLVDYTHPTTGDFVTFERTSIDRETLKRHGDRKKAAGFKLESSAAVLTDAHAAAPLVIIGEGVETTASFARLVGVERVASVLAAGNKDQLQKVAKALAEAGPPRAAIVAADADAVKEATNAAAALENQGWTVAVAVPGAPVDWQGDKRADWNDLLQRLGAAPAQTANLPGQPIEAAEAALQKAMSALELCEACELQKVHAFGAPGPVRERVEAIRNAGAIAADAFALEEPTPLVRETPAGAPYPLEALGPLRAVAEAIHDKTQAPVAIGAQAALGVAALAAQGFADVETLGGRAPASLFLLTVAQSGERKSSCDKLAMKPVRAFEQELRDAHKADNPKHATRHAIWKERGKEILRSAKDDAVAAEADLLALGPEPEAPLAPKITMAEPTFEGIVKHMGGLRASLGLFSDEGGGFFGGHGMNPENRLKTMAGLSKLWDGEPVDRQRAGDEVATFAGRRFSTHLMIQPTAAATVLSDPMASGQGFLPRFLVTEPPSAIGTRLRHGCDPASDHVLAAFEARIGALLRQPLPLRDGARNELEPPLLTLSDDARDVLQAFADDVERAQAPGGGLEAVRAFASKAAEHAARLAAVLTLYADERAREVSGETMANAVTLATFYANEAARLADAATISKETAEAEKMRRWLLESWSELVISATDAAQRGPFKETDRARKTFVTLERHGWLVAVEGGAMVKGKHRREAWRVVRGPV